MFIGHEVIIGIKESNSIRHFDRVISERKCRVRPCSAYKLVCENSKINDTCIYPLVNKDLISI